MKKLIKKCISSLLVMIMTFSAVIITQVQVYALSQNDVVSWMSSKSGSTINDGGTQCVAAFNSYLRLFGISNPISKYPVNSAYQIFNYNAPDGWQKIAGSGNYRLGDVVIWGSSIGGGHGHVGIVYSTNGTVRIFDQNYVSKNVCGIHNISQTSAIRGIFRPPLSANNFPGNEDTSWNIPVWKTANYKVNTYDSYGNQESSRWIDQGDNCYVEKVYQNGFAWVKYPSSASSDGYRWAFTNAAAFSLDKKGEGFPGAEDTSWQVPVWKTANYKLNTYDSSGNQESSRWIDQGDNCYVEKVFQNGYAWVKYPSTASSDGYRWAYTKADGFSLDKKNWYSGLTPVNLGTDFYAYIINTGAWKMATNDGSNVSLRTETGNPEQVWKFERQSDGSYKIINTKDNNVLDDDSCGTSDGSNIQVWGSNDSSAQRWFIYGESGAFFLRAACGDLVMDISGGLTDDGTNVQLWTKNDTAAQKYQIWKLNKAGSTRVNCVAGSTFTPTEISWSTASDTLLYDVYIRKSTASNGEMYKILKDVNNTSVYVDLPEGSYEAYVNCKNKYSNTRSDNVIQFTVSHGDSASFGNSFTANIVSTKGNLFVGAVSDGNVNLQTKNDDDSQRWIFEQQVDNSYRVINKKYNLCMSVYNGLSVDKTNICLTQPNNDSSQFFYIRRNNNGYSIIPKCNLSGAVDIEGGNLISNANVLESTYTGKSSQLFSIEYLSITPSAVKEFNGHKYECFNLTTTWDQAYRICEQRGGHLATVDSKNENDFLQSFAAEYNPYSWMGATDFPEKGNWLWITGESFDYSNWDSGKTNSSSSDYRYMVMNTNTGLWENLSALGVSSNVGFVCEYDISDNINPAEYIPTKTFEYNGIKYEIYNNSVDWNTAKRICRLKKGNLAEIKSLEENTAIQAEISDNGVDMFWINATDVTLKETWTNSSHEPLVFTNWESTEPDNANNIETYAVIKNDGKWKDVYSFFGYVGKVGFICKYDKFSAGDVNSDGKVNMKDIVLLQQYLNNWNVSIDFDASDVNADGRVNMKDIVYLQQYLNGWNVSLK